MALVLDPARLAEAVSPEAPCGPDLEEEGDLDFLNGISHVESLLPASFFTRDDEGRPQPFDRASIDFARETKALLALLERTRDIRILALLARLAMLDRDLPGFAGALTAIAVLLETEWESVHPRGEGGSFDLRSAILHSLDDVPTVVLPLQHLVLAQSRRYGAISFRSVMIADGEVPPRENEPAPDRVAVEQAIEEAEPEAIAARLESLGAVAGAVARITGATVAQGGYEARVNLERLGGLAGRIRALLESGRAEDGPAGEAAAASGPPDAPAATAAPAAPRPAGRLASVADASAALAAAGLYLRGHEPSSPAEVLVRQARMLVGKSFLEVMRILIPSYASDATIAIGANRGLRLTFDQLSAVPEEAGGGADTDSWGADAAEDAAAVPPAQTFKAATRAEAMALIREAGTFFRNHEPSSPIPLLLEKAAGMADRDFLAILRDVLPDLNAP